MHNELVISVFVQTFKTPTILFHPVHAWSGITRELNPFRFEWMKLRMNHSTILLIHQAPDRIASEVEKLQEIFNSILQALRAIWRSNKAHQAQLDQRLAQLPRAIAEGVQVNRVLDGFEGLRAVHLCFGNYRGQTIQKGDWGALIGFLNALQVDHLVLEMAHRPPEEIEALKYVDPRIHLGIGVVDVKVNHIETAEEIAERLDTLLFCAC